MADRFVSHRITQRGLVIRGESGAEIIVPLDRAKTLLSAVQRSLGEPDAVPESTERRQIRSLSRVVKLT